VSKCSAPTCARCFCMIRSIADWNLESVARSCALSSLRSAAHCAFKPRGCPDAPSPTRALSERRPPALLSSEKLSRQSVACTMIASIRLFARQEKVSLDRHNTHDRCKAKQAMSSVNVAAVLLDAEHASVRAESAICTILVGGTSQINGLSKGDNTLLAQPVSPAHFAHTDASHLGQLCLETSHAIQSGRRQLIVDGQCVAESPHVVARSSRPCRVSRRHRCVPRQSQKNHCTNTKVER
jgi:hypothetical protein